MIPNQKERLVSNVEIGKDFDEIHVQRLEDLVKKFEGGEIKPFRAVLKSQFGNTRGLFIGFSKEGDKAKIKTSAGDILEFDNYSYFRKDFSVVRPLRGEIPSLTDFQDTDFTFEQTEYEDTHFNDRCEF